MFTHFNGFLLLIHDYPSSNLYGTAFIVFVKLHVPQVEDRPENFEQIFLVPPGEAQSVERLHSFLETIQVVHSVNVRAFTQVKKGELILML